MMKPRNQIKPKDKKSNIKWIAIGVGALLLLGGIFWFFLENQDTASTSKPSENGQTEAPKEPAEQQPEEKQESTEAPATNQEEKAAEEKTPEDASKEQATEKPEPETPAPDKKVDATQYPENMALPAEPTIIKNILLANKQHPLPATFAPGEVKEARTAFEAMRTEALKAGIDLNAFSTYRGFDRQKQLYAGYVAKDGQEAADRYSARPGFSEHQTGLAFDIGESGQEQHWASSSFGDTKGGKWLKENAHKFGFILRYPEGAENITGYMHESWHYRYVGKEAAADIYAKGITLEEYLGVN